MLSIFPLITTLPRSPFLNNDGDAFIMPVKGAITTFFADFTSAFLTITCSPRLVLAFFLIVPSILMIFKPISPGYPLATIP